MERTRETSQPCATTLGVMESSRLERMGMLGTFKQRMLEGALASLEAIGFIASLAGASVSLFLGKFFAAVLFVLLAVGVLNRFVRRRRGDLAEEQRTPVWVLVTCLVLSIIEAGVVVEASNLPVRFNQPGFEKSNWLFVAALLLVFFFGQRYLFRRLLARRQADAPATPR
jgi:hypothetical protein